MLRCWSKKVSETQHVLAYHDDADLRCDYPLWCILMKVSKHFLPNSMMLAGTQVVINLPEEADLQRA